MEYQHRYYLEKWLGGHPRVEQVRICGTIAAMEVKTDAQSSYFNAIGSILRARFLEEGFLLRPLGNTIYLMPPYCITASELEAIYQGIRRVLDTL
jgi:adenosylmethionine-8-amino-7-oxononanoate aminotransferase